MKEKNKDEIKRIIKYIFSAGTSFFLDLLIFTILNEFIFKNFSISIIVSTICARILSSLYNYFINSKYVFKSNDKKAIFKYYALVIIQMFVSAFSVQILNTIFAKMNDSLIKLFVDVIIFVVNYFIQKKVVFK